MCSVIVDLIEAGIRSGKYIENQCDQFVYCMMHSESTRSFLIGQYKVLLERFGYAQSDTVMEKLLSLVNRWYRCHHQWSIINNVCNNTASNILNIYTDWLRVTFVYDYIRMDCKSENAMISPWIWLWFHVLFLSMRGSGLGAKSIFKAFVWCSHRISKIVKLPSSYKSQKSWQLLTNLWLVKAQIQRAKNSLIYLVESTWANVQGNFLEHCRS